jgi:hypothetical protein
LKAEADSSSRGQEDFICREEERKVAWGHAAEPGNQWSHGSGWKLGFIAFLFCPRVEMSLRCKQMFPGKEKYLLGQLLPSGTSCSPSFTCTVTDISVCFILLVTLF